MGKDKAKPYMCYTRKPGSDDAYYINKVFLEPIDEPNKSQFDKVNKIREGMPEYEPKEEIIGKQLTFNKAQEIVIAYEQNILNSLDKTLIQTDLKPTPDEYIYAYKFIDGTKVCKSEEGLEEKFVDEFKGCYSLNGR